MAPGGRGDRRESAQPLTREEALMVHWYYHKLLLYIEYGVL
jgi:hypothetical protein